MGSEYILDMQVRHTQLDDRLIVQWALPYDDCASDMSPSPSPTGAAFNNLSSEKGIALTTA